MNPFARMHGESRTDAVLGGSAYMLVSALIYVGIPAFVLVLFLKLVVWLYVALPF